MNAEGPGCTGVSVGAAAAAPHLIQVVNKVRGQLSRLDRKTLSALIVIDVHARDVITELATLVSHQLWSSGLASSRSQLVFKTRSK